MDDIKSRWNPISMILCKTISIKNVPVSSSYELLYQLVYVALQLVNFYWTISCLNLFTHFFLLITSQNLLWDFLHLKTYFLSLVIISSSAISTRILRLCINSGISNAFFWPGSCSIKSSSSSGRLCRVAIAWYPEDTRTCLVK